MNSSQHKKETPHTRKHTHIHTHKERKTPYDILDPGFEVDAGDESTSGK